MYDITIIGAGPAGLTAGIYGVRANKKVLVLEAMSYGVVPVVYGSYESVYDIITNGEDGFITNVPFRNEEMSEL